MSVFSSAFKSLFMHMCVCVEAWKRGLALSITKKEGVHTAYNSVKEGGKERQGRDETEQCVSPSLLSQLALTSGRKAFHRWASWSKREFVQSNFILTFLAFFSTKLPPHPLPLYCNSLANQFIGPCGPRVFMQWRYEHNGPKRRKATDQMVTKATNEIEATHTCMHG